MCTCECGENLCGGPFLAVQADLRVALAVPGGFLSGQVAPTERIAVRTSTNRLPAATDSNPVSFSCAVSALSPGAYGSWFVSALVWNTGVFRRYPVALVAGDESEDVLA